MVKAVKEPSVYRGGEWFRDNIETSLPYVKTVAPYKEDECKGVFMDEDNLVVEVHTEAIIQLCLTLGLCEMLGKGVRYGREQPTGTRDVNIGAYADADGETDTDVEGEQEGDGLWTWLWR